MTEEFQRQTAYRVWIKDIQNPESENSVPLADGKPIYRVNLIAPIIQKTNTDNNNYTAITLDDGTAQIRVKTWREDTKLLEGLKQGETTLVVGQLKEYNEEIYIIPEIIKKVKPIWELVRKLELFQEYGKPEVHAQQIQPMQQVQQPVIQQETKIETVTEEIVSESNQVDENRQKIMKTLEKLDSPEGVDIDSIRNDSQLDESDILKIIQELVSEGQIFQLQENKFKIM